MELTFEIFTSDLARSREFYVQILGFQIEQQEPGGYARLRRGNASIALNDLKRIPESHPSRQEPGETVGLGFEISLSVKDIDACYAGIQDLGAEIEEPLKERPWGARDFCLRDPDGNYLRITST